MITMSKNARTSSNAFLLSIRLSNETFRMRSSTFGGGSTFRTPGTNPCSSCSYVREKPEDVSVALVVGFGVGVTSFLLRAFFLALSTSLSA